MANKTKKSKKMGFSCLDLQDDELTMLIKLIEAKRRVERTDEIFLPYEKLGWIEEKTDSRGRDISQVAKKLLNISFESRGYQHCWGCCIFSRTKVWADNGLTIKFSEDYGEFVQDGNSLLEERAAEKFYEILEEEAERWASIDPFNLKIDWEGYGKKKSEGWIE
jgi:hypothetical protein